MKDYRQVWGILIESFKSGVLDLPALAESASKLEIIDGVDESWAIYHQDKRICEVIDQVRKDESIRVQGNEEELAELVTRFMLSQLLFDWRGPLMAACLEWLDHKTIQASGLNQLLGNWDFTYIYKR